MASQRTAHKHTIQRRLNAEIMINSLVLPVDSTLRVIDAIRSNADVQARHRTTNARGSI